MALPGMDCLFFFEENEGEVLQSFARGKQQV